MIINWPSSLTRPAQRRPHHVGIAARPPTPRTGRSGSRRERASSPNVDQLDRPVVDPPKPAHAALRREQNSTPRAQRHRRQAHQAGGLTMARRHRTTKSAGQSLWPDGRKGAVSRASCHGDRPASRHMSASQTPIAVAVGYARFDPPAKAPQPAPLTVAEGTTVASPNWTSRPGRAVGADGYGRMDSWWQLVIASGPTHPESSAGRASGRYRHLR